MIEIRIENRKATLIKTVDLPTGNDASIGVKFIFDSDVAWEGTLKIPTFTAITPYGLKKTLPGVLDFANKTEIPGKIVGTPYSVVSVGLRGIYADGTEISTNMVLIGKTAPGAGGDVYQDVPIDKSDFDAFLEKLSAETNIRVEVLSSRLSALIADAIDEENCLRLMGAHSLLTVNSYDDLPSSAIVGDSAIVMTTTADLCDDGTLVNVHPSGVYEFSGEWKRVVGSRSSQTVALPCDGWNDANEMNVTVPGIQATDEVEITCDTEVDVIGVYLNGVTIRCKNTPSHDITCVVSFIFRGDTNDS